MIIQLGFYKRRKGISLDEFHRLWSGIYGPMYAEHHELRRHLRRYVQHRLSPMPGQSQDDLPYDGFSEAWFDSEADAEALRNEPIFVQKIAPMVGDFLDLEGMRFSATDSQVQIVGSVPPLYVPG
jgi:hypothetical protein